MATEKVVTQAVGVKPTRTSNEAPPSAAGLERSLTLPMLVLYGVGVTVGAGIFALIGEILAVSGDRAPLAFLVAGLIAGVTGVSFMMLVREYPRAGGEAVYVRAGLGSRFGRVAGYGVVLTGTISSAVVALAFGGYLASLIDVSRVVGALMILALLTLVACAGVKESVLVAAIVTLIELGTLVIVGVFGLPKLADADLVGIVLRSDEPGFAGPVLAGAVVAFFAFIGFEDIANMAEETIDPRRTAPRAIAWTLGISILIYVLLASIAIVLPDRAEIVESDAPMATLFESVSGRGADVVSTVASLAMTNGILVQVIMASRVLFGMANERLLPGPLRGLGEVSPRLHTPIRATVGVALAVSLLVVLVPLGQLARVTSLFTLGVFTLVNLSLFMLGNRGTGKLHQWRYVGLLGAVLAMALALWEISSLI